MGTPDGAGITVVAATRLEASAVRRAAPAARVIRAGIGLRRLRQTTLPGAVISCGLAGGVRAGLHTGAVLIPTTVLRPGGEWLACDPFFVDALSTAARRMGFEPERGPLGTAPAMVRGARRRSWMERGCVGVDMETGLLRAPRIAAVRVVLDTPERDLSDAWQTPLLALARPWIWAEALWLCREAPRCARRAAAVLAACLAACAAAGSEPPDG